MSDLLHQAFRDLPFLGLALIRPGTHELVRVNQVLSDMVGSTPDGMTGKSWADVAQPELLEADLAMFSRVEQGQSGAHKHVTRLLHADGRVVHVEVDVRPRRAADGSVDLLVATVANITARVAAEAAAYEAAALLEHLSHEVPGVIYQFRQWPDGRIGFPFASAAIRDIYEVSPEEVKEDASIVLDRLHPDDYDMVMASIARSAETLEPWQCDYRVVLPRQGLRWRTGNARPERMADGSILWHGFITDSTEQEQARVALRESEARFRIQVEHAPEAIVVYDVEANRFIDVNRNAEELFGLTREALTQRSIADVSPARQPDGRPSEEAGAAFVQLAVDGNAPVFQWSHVHATGREIPCEVRLVRLPHEGRTLVRGSVTDIAARKAATDALLRVQAAIDSSLSGIAMADLEGRLTYANKACLELWGFEHESDVLGRSARTFFGDSKEPLDFMTTLGETGSWAGEMTAVRADGTHRVVQVNASVMLDSRGDEAGMFGSFVDVTEERRLQTQLLQAQKMESVGRLAGGIAHDFNNLLTVMKGLLELSIAAVPEGSQTHADLMQVQRAADSAAALTQQLLAFSRRQMIAPVVLDLNSVVQRVHGMLQRLLGEHISLCIVTDPDLGRVRFDPGQAEQILINLAINARDAMPDGGQLTLETSNVSLARPAAQGPGEVDPCEYVLLTVSDTGVGMNAETREHAFEPFFTTKVAGRGTGLGLAMIHGAVSQNGGHVEVTSEPGRGSIFRIYLPRVFDEIRSDVVRVTGDAPRGAETILLVEDDAMVRTLTSRLLARQGFRVVEFPDGEAALTWLRGTSDDVALLLTDVVMPGMNGKVLSEAVRQFRPHVRVLFASGYPADVLAQHDMRTPGIEFLAKPFTIAMLAARVREVLDASPA